MYAYLLLLIASALGIFLTFFLYRVRQVEKPVPHAACPSHMDCHLMVAKRFVNFFGIPIELLGLAFFACVFLLYLFLWAFPQFQMGFLTLIVLGISLAAGLFCLYLFALQLFNYHRLCYWCISVALLVGAVFSSAVIVSNLDLLGLLADYKPFFLVMHLVGVGLGIGGATITDTFFFKFLKDLRISKWEASILHIVSDVIWVGLALLIVSGLAMYLPEMEALNASAKFLAKVIITTIILINGIILNLYISPRLIDISFGRRHPHRMGELHVLRKIAFGAGAVSITSWYSVLTLGALSRQHPWSLFQMMVVYVLVLAVAVLASQFLEWYYNRKSMS